MSASSDDRGASTPALLCFDGSDDASCAIAQAGALLRPSGAVVLTVWEPLPLWEPYDPVTVLRAPLAGLAARGLGLDEIAQEVAEATMAHGVSLARASGFTAEGRTARGKSWRTICDLAEQIDAAVIVLGARGLSRVQSVLLGSVSSAVAVHAERAVLIVPHRKLN